MFYNYAFFNKHDSYLIFGNDFYTHHGVLYTFMSILPYAFTHMYKQIIILLRVESYYMIGILKKHLSVYQHHGV